MGYTRAGDGGEVLRGGFDRLGVDVDDAVGEFPVKGLALVVDVAEGLSRLHRNAAAFELGDTAGDGFV